MLEGYVKPMHRLCIRRRVRRKLCVLRLWNQNGLDGLNAGDRAPAAAAFSCAVAREREASHWQTASGLSRGKSSTGRI